MQKLPNGVKRYKKRRLKRGVGGGVREKLSGTKDSKDVARGAGVGWRPPLGVSPDTKLTEKRGNMRKNDLKIKNIDKKTC